MRLSPHSPARASARLRRPSRAPAGPRAAARARCAASLPGRGPRPRARPTAAEAAARRPGVPSTKRARAPSLPTSRFILLHGKRRRRSKLQHNGRLDYTPPAMCRLFGCRSRDRDRVSHELFHGANALRVQSREHPDGWGVGWYEDGTPRVVRSLTPAHGDADFEKLSQFVSAQTVVAHVRKASVGRVAEENTHPFQRGPWLFAHNGTLPDWERVQPQLETLIDPSLRGELQGETDSERCFLLFLSRLQRHCDPERSDAGSAAAALAETVALVREIAEHGDARASTTFLATDGRLSLACRRARTLFLSSPAPDQSGACGYVAIASEDPGEPAPGGKRAWRLLPEEALVAVDERLRLRVTSLLPE